ncbi:hypothetical protein HNR12_003011 [Streptomonospora nanhaiensis]|uniref:Uncharacterized protein n=1 Tax=Streptomonospora nanhaiensis TaxID=1323731 RepID=A0A853BPM1_9ACTN|nr:hypothetical protein [Streptomonospora nanhaiensis]
MVRGSQCKQARRTGAVRIVRPGVMTPAGEVEVAAV